MHTTRRKVITTRCVFTLRVDVYMIRPERPSIDNCSAVGRLRRTRVMPVFTYHSLKTRPPHTSSITGETTTRAALLNGCQSSCIQTLSLHPLARSLVYTQGRRFPPKLCRVHSHSSISLPLLLPPLPFPPYLPFPSPFFLPSALPPSFHH